MPTVLSPAMLCAQTRASLLPMSLPPTFIRVLQGKKFRKIPWGAVLQTPHQLALLHIWEPVSKLQEEHLPCNPFHSPGHRERPGEWTNFDKTSQLCQNNPVNRYQRPALRMAGTLASQVTAGGESPVPSRGREGRTATQRTSWRGESRSQTWQDHLNLSSSAQHPEAREWKDPVHSAKPLGNGPSQRKPTPLLCTELERPWTLVTLTLSRIYARFLRSPKATTYIIKIYYIETTQKLTFRRKSECPWLTSAWNPLLCACWVASLPGQKLQGQLQAILQGPQLLHVAAHADVVKEEARAELLLGEKAQLSQQQSQIRIHIPQWNKTILFTQSFY